eukprot:g5834.t1
MVTDQHRVKRRGSQTIMDVAGDVESDADKPSWLEALMMLAAQILPHTEEVPGYWEDVAVFGRPIDPRPGADAARQEAWAAGHAGSDAGSGGDSDAEEGGSDAGGVERMHALPPNEGVLKYFQLDALAISTLFRLLEFQPAANKLVLTGLTHSGLTVAARTLATNRTLLSLNLSGNAIGPPGVHLLAGALAANRVLRRLVLRRTGACDGGEVGGLQALCSAVARHPALTDLDLAECGLRVLSLARNPLVERDGLFAVGDTGGLHALLSTLVRGDAVRTLTALDLAGVSLGTDGLALIVTALARGCAGGAGAIAGAGSGELPGGLLGGASGGGRNSLRVLDLRGNDLGEPGGLRLIEAAAPLTELCALSGVPLGPLRRGALRTLALRGTGVALAECVLLASFLRTHPGCLRSLDLCDNTLGVAGVRYVAAAVGEQLHLRELLLGNCDIADGAGGTGVRPEGVLALAEALEQARRFGAPLRVLDLRDNVMCGAYAL